MKKVRMIVEMDEELYKAFAEQDIFISGMRTGKTLLSEIWKAVKNATPLTECDDCVSRQAVKNGMIKYGFHASDMTVTEFVEDELPPVLPKREQGEWLDMETTQRYHIYGVCSLCHEVNRIGKACRSCGALMKVKI